jgi:hypothetical protein
MAKNQTGRDVEPAVADAIQRVLRERLKPIGFERADIRAEEDYDGDNILHIDAFYRLMKKPIKADATFGLTTALRSALRPLGETRFPYVKHHFHEKQRVAG